jgi:hypothetical protein
MSTWRRPLAGQRTISMGWCRIDHELAVALRLSVSRGRAASRRPQARHNCGRRHDLGLFRIAHDVSSLERLSTAA